MEAADANMPDPRASQKVAATVEGAPRCMSCNGMTIASYLQELVRTVTAAGANGQKHTHRKKCCSDPLRLLQSLLLLHQLLRA